MLKAKLREVRLDISLILEARRGYEPVGLNSEPLERLRGRREKVDHEHQPEGAGPHAFTARAPQYKVLALGAL